MGFGGLGNMYPPNEPRWKREVPALLPQVIYPSFFQAYGVTHSLQPLGHRAQHFLIMCQRWEELSQGEGEEGDW